MNMRCLQIRKQHPARFEYAHKISEMLLLLVRVRARFSPCGRRILHKPLAICLACRWNICMLCMRIFIIDTSINTTIDKYKLLTYAQKSFVLH